MTDKHAPGAGHNSQIGGIAAEALRQFVERIERLEEEKKALTADIKEVYAQAKAQGFDTKIIRKVIARRKRNAQEIEEEEQLLDLYLAAIGDFVSTPLGEAGAWRITEGTSPS